MAGDITVRKIFAGEEQKVSDLIYSSLDNVVSTFYEPKVIAALKALYVPEKISSHGDVFVAVQDGRIIACIAITENTAKMFYAEKSMSGYRAAGTLAKLVFEKHAEKGNLEIEAVVLASAAPFMRRIGGKDEETVKVTEGGVSFLVKKFKFKLRRVNARARQHDIRPMTAKDSGPSFRDLERARLRGDKKKEGRKTQPPRLPPNMRPRRATF